MLLLHVLEENGDEKRRKHEKKTKNKSKRKIEKKNEEEKRCLRVYPITGIRHDVFVVLKKAEKRIFL